MVEKLMWLVIIVCLLIIFTTQCRAGQYAVMDRSTGMLRIITCNSPDKPAGAVPRAKWPAGLRKRTVPMRYYRVTANRVVKRRTAKLALMDGPRSKRRVVNGEIQATAQVIEP